ncbi:hypothetical protein ASZ90_019680 [hydrocarbon metagenome]|uniref:Uncharacterized protein n=1 Tax=hydrocarbon metagenome TaxID=938273 RepID=A0A0W8E2Q0_9ZZZZ
MDKICRVIFTWAAEFYCPAVKALMYKNNYINSKTASWIMLLLPN